MERALPLDLARKPVAPLGPCRISISIQAPLEPIALTISPAFSSATSLPPTPQLEARWSGPLTTTKYCGHRTRSGSCCSRNSRRASESESSEDSPLACRRSNSESVIDHSSSSPSSSSPPPPPLPPVPPEPRRYPPGDPEDLGDLGSGEASASGVAGATARATDATEGRRVGEPLLLSWRAAAARSQRSLAWRCLAACSWSGSGSKRSTPPPRSSRDKTHPSRYSAESPPSAPPSSGFSSEPTRAPAVTVSGGSSKAT
mmetsp:Transcript_28032/g.62520  ORF Transcript_28032/g.62520 Transcript_28032/m.62520 type:complete len:258 (+) Transcript_28032:228-1001(+)